jgi:hypothetical protein
MNKEKEKDQKSSAAPKEAVKEKSRKRKENASGE